MLHLGSTFACHHQGTRSSGVTAGGMPCALGTKAMGFVRREERGLQRGAVSPEPHVSSRPGCEATLSVPPDSAP